MKQTSPVKRALIACVAAVSVVAPNSSHATNLIADSLAVQGGAVIGLDATAGYTFGLDTLVLRQDNLRIFFNDSTTNAGYPNNNWRMTINDSTSGGANYFAIDDVTGAKTPFKIMAGAPEGSLYVASNGKLGLKTTTPALDIHTVSSDTPGLRLEQNNSGGYTAQTWDVAGNEANFFVRDLTGGSKLPFRIRPGAPTSTLDLSASGWVGVGTDHPHAKLHVEANASNGDGVIIGLSGNVSTNLATLHVDGTGYFSQKLGIGANSAAQNTTLYVDGTAFVSQTLEIGSSRTRKENIRDLSLDEAKAALKDLNPVQFKYKGDGQQQLGFIAEDVPDLVATKNRKSVVPMDFVAVLTKVVQDHEQREAELQQTIKSQQDLLQDLTKRLEAMEQRASANNNTTAQH